MAADGMNFAIIHIKRQFNQTPQDHPLYLKETRPYFVL
jgi:hypothetical protein